MRVSSDVISRTVDGEEALLDLATQKYYGLNRSGTLVWKLLEQGKSLDAIAAALCEAFEIDEKTARRDAAALIGDLEAKGLARAKR